MTIAVHIHLSDDKNYPDFNYRCITILAATYPEHNFVFIFDTPFDPSLFSQKNITPVLLTPQIRNRLLGHYWYNYKIPGLLKKYNAALFVSNGINCSLRTTIKQCLILPDLSFLQKENIFSRNDVRYINKFYKKFISTAACIAVCNEHTRVLLSNLFPATAKKSHNIGYPVNDPVKSFDDDEMKNTRSRYTEGKEYFLCYVTDASLSNTTVLLKAFSAFKKRQLSNMQLVLLFSTTHKENPVKDFALYKYRDEVKVMFPDTEDLLVQITSAAYAAIYLPAIELMDDKGIITLKNNIPLIIAKNDFNKSLYGDAALFTTVDEKNIAENMMLLYKDEHTRNELMNKGKFLAKAFTWDNTAFNLWKAILETTEQ